ncbi:hypothetical protein MAPG_05832 [Magnaporthiopsis poae ATCC 64411]|uniref:Uncharacterized protein n=1 Tax=Magnaporthiopsis poae (strain ATCC 64411 / 73-15) TaxID=644358 RepID=A0A0C4E0F8_MAGP6|nr:hypothetical protein MAPG_05832 [Magnaporthiopsis poae ATCC 64411]
MALPPSGSPLIAMVAPLTVLVLLVTCAALRRAVRRRRSSIGPSAPETFPWSWISVCVEDRRARPDPWGDDDDYYYAQCIAGSYAVEQQRNQDQDQHPKTAATVEQEHACRGESEKEQGGADAESPPRSPAFPKPVFHFENFDFARAGRDGKDALGVGSGGGVAREEPSPDPLSEAQHDPKKGAGSLSKPPMLHLPSDIGARESRWELETKQL